MPPGAKEQGAVISPCNPPSPTVCLWGQRTGRPLYLPVTPSPPPSPPQYASWDLAFHMIPFAKVDPDFAMGQLMLFLREWYMAPNGQIPAYEFAFDDVNPPVHAWAVMRVYKMTAPKGQRDGAFLAKCFQKLILNFNWYVEWNGTGWEGMRTGHHLLHARAERVIVKPCLPHI